MIARGEYTSHPNFVLPKHEGPNATEMMANDIVKLYLYASKQIDDFPNLKLRNCFVYFIQTIIPWRMVFYFFILLLWLLSY